MSIDKKRFVYAMELGGVFFAGTVYGIALERLFPGAGPDFLDKAIVRVGGLFGRGSKREQVLDAELQGYRTRNAQLHRDMAILERENALERDRARRVRDAWEELMGGADSRWLPSSDWPKVNAVNAAVFSGVPLPSAAQKEKIK